MKNFFECTATPEEWNAAYKLIIFCLFLVIIGLAFRPEVLY